MPRRRVGPTRRQFKNRAAYLATHWAYAPLLRAALISTRRPIYRGPGPGLTKAEAVAAVRAHEVVLGREPLADISMSDLVKSFARHELLDRSGASGRTRYYPPGYLKDRRAMHLKDVGAELARLLSGAVTIGEVFNPDLDEPEEEDEDHERTTRA
jgi:hypothetical protein